MTGFIFNGTLAAVLSTTLEEIARGLCAYGDTSISWLLGFSFLLHIISIWKYMALIDRINTIGKSLETFAGQEIQALHETMIK